MGQFRLNATDEGRSMETGLIGGAEKREIKIEDYDKEAIAFDPLIAA